MQMITEDEVAGNYVNQVIFVTDGAANRGVTEPDQILKGIHAVNSKMAASPISMFGIGIGDDQGTQWLQSLNYPLIRQISIQNGGRDLRVKRSETTQHLARFYRILESPQMAQIRVRYDSEDFAVTQLTGNSFNTLYAGSDIVICGKLERKTKDIEHGSNLMVSAVVESVGNKQIEKSFGFHADRGNNGQMDVQRIWAYLTLKNYEKLLLQNEEIVDHEMRRLINQNALNVALSHKLVTPWTSMVVVDETEQERNAYLHSTEESEPMETMRMNKYKSYNPTLDPTSDPTRDPTANPTSAPTASLRTANDQTSGILLLDVAALSIGIAVNGNVTRVIIPRNSAIPTRKSIELT